MRGARWLLAALGVASVGGVVACSSDSVSNGSLGFSVAESLLVLFPEDPTSGYALLSSGTGTCAALQTGVTVAGDAEIASLGYLLVPLAQVDASNTPLPLAATTYTIVDPANPTASPPGAFAVVAAVSTDLSCDPTEDDANSGTVTISPFDTTDGGSSPFNFSAIFDQTTRVTGSYTLSTCLVSLDAGVPAGTCVACDFPVNGAACAIQ
jgi:hypothetical protein